MSWPPSSDFSNGIGYISQGITTLAWGTDGLYTPSSGALAIVLSMRDQYIIEEPVIENGSGVVTVDVIIKQGEQTEITVIDDRASTYKRPGQVITIFSPLPNGVGATSTDYQVIDANYNAARKEPGQRVILAKKYTLITPAAITNA